MNEQELRSLVREAIERHLGRPEGATYVAPYGGTDAENAEVRRARFQSRFEGADASHLLLRVVPGSEIDGACVIEPSVRCNHCGFCQSYGH
jgi:hypothetical protein